MRLHHFVRQVRCYWRDTLSVRDFARLMQVRLSRSKIGWAVCPRPKLVRVRMRSFGGELWLRSHSTDISVMDEHLLHGAYHDTPTGLGTIVDLGAYTGITARWLAARNPGARIICVEPDPDNLEVLHRNALRTLGTIRVVEACIGGTQRTVSLATSNGSWAYEMRDDPAGTIPVVTMDQLVTEYGLDRIDLLKSNIEGAEREVFLGPGAWVDRVEHAVIEWHGQDSGHITAVTGWDLVRKGQSHDDCEFLFLERA